MIAVTPEEMKIIEEKAVLSGKVSLEELMEKAGEALAEEVLKEAPEKVLVVSGPGNNGGDGLVAARILAEKGVRVKAFLIKPEKISPLVSVQLEKLKETKVEFLSSLEELKQELKILPLVVDALFGFGFRGKAVGEIGEIIKAINHSGATVYSADVPSGVEAGSGKVNGPACRAKVTVTFSLPKVGLYFWPGCEYVGEVRVREVVPQEFLAEAKGLEILTSEEASQLLPRRSKEAHKWLVGGVMVLAGSEGMTGAAVLAVKGAQRAGAGIVKLVSPAKLAPVFASSLIEAVFLFLEDGLSAEEKTELVKKDMSRYRAVLVGPGLKDLPETRKLVKEVLKQGKPAVLDATALSFWSEISPQVPDFPLIVTPHEGEFSRLTGYSLDYIRENRLEAAVNYLNMSQRENLVLVLKGYRTLIVSKNRKAINLTGGPALASAGTGDVLAGVIAAFLAQGLEPFDAALLGTYLHGFASDLAIRNLGELSLSASDLLSYLPRAILRIQS